MIGIGPCPGCGKGGFLGSYERQHHVALCTVQPTATSTRPKENCPHHGKLPDGRPDPPAGYCGPSCWMRPGVAEREEAAA